MNIENNKSPHIGKSNIEQYIDRLKEYIEKEDVDSYSEKTILRDIIYFMGVAINEGQYRYCDGAEKFIEYLIKNIK